MKKYLMTGMAAVVFGGLFTSCSHDIEDGGSTQEQIQKTYEKAFVTRFGQPVADLDWGFGSTQANTREENANANEWADPDKEYGGLLVPPPLTDEQIAVVKEYFQSVKNIPYNDPQWTNFFIQQVYKGHTGAKTGTNPAYNEPYSPEAYMALNGTTELYASDYMDHLAAINDEVNPEFVDHINNFNHGDCGENDHVLKKGGNANDGPFYTDKIMYMKNSTTKSFGYYNSNGSLRHTEYTGLVSWTTIRDWANEHNLNGNCLADGWNRSFMGFDFEQMIDDQCYATEWVNGVEVAKTLRFNQYSAELIINGETPTNYVYQYNGQPVKMLSDQMNRYCGVKIDVTDEQLYTDLYDADNNNAYIGKQLNTDFIDGLLAQGYLPIDNKSLREWAIVGGCADGYYSDWIVTLAEAKTENTPQDEWEAIRVIAEDLTVESDKEGNSDFDFNDVVFDVRRCISGPSQGTVQVILKAAGGTLPLYLDGQEVHELYKAANPTLDIDQYTMINTHAESKGLKGKSNLADITFTPTSYSGSTIREIANSINVYVVKGDKPCELKAPKGDVASKIAVGTDFEWCNERQDIDDKYSLNDGTSLLKEYVKGALGTEWYTFTKR
ncbi:MAG: hypothetical protein IKU49_06025 [Prevotella sp.]|nr:hypothetical protein [Prevotella sp.]